MRSVHKTWQQRHSCAYSPELNDAQVAPEETTVHAAPRRLMRKYMQTAWWWTVSARIFLASEEPNMLDLMASLKKTSARAVFMI